LVADLSAGFVVKIEFAKKSTNLGMKMMMRYQLSIVSMELN